MPRKTTFECGHRGAGQYCHRCKQERDQAAKRQDERRRQLDERRTDKAAWDATFAADAIDLRGLQTRERVIKARDLLARLAAGEPYTSLNGKRWESDRSIVSVPIGWGYRLVLREQAGQIRPMKVLTHEDYNNLKPGALGGAARGRDA
jgi:hypothetical protein